MKIHSRGWYSAYADPEKAAFKGSAPLNMTGMSSLGCLVDSSQPTSFTLSAHLRPWNCQETPALFPVPADRLHQVERWATGAVEIFFSHRNPLWSHCGSALFLRQRIA